MGRGLSESVKKGKFVTKTFFSDIPSISILPVKYGGRGGGGFAERTKSVKRDESHLSTVL